MLNLKEKLKESEESLKRAEEDVKKLQEEKTNQIKNGFNIKALSKGPLKIKSIIKPVEG